MSLVSPTQVLAPGVTPRRFDGAPMHLVIDMDNTLADTTAAGVKWLNGLLDMRLGVADTPAYAFFEGFGIDEEMYHVIYAAHGHELHWDSDPYPFAVDVVRALHAQHHRITVVTARPPIYANVSRDWLARHGIPCHAFHCESNKLDFCQRNGVDLIIEDAAHYAHQFTANGRPLMLLDHDYNRHVQHDLLYRVADWSAIARWFGIDPAAADRASTPPVTP